MAELRRQENRSHAATQFRSRRFRDSPLTLCFAIRRYFGSRTPTKLTSLLQKSRDVDACTVSILTLSLAEGTRHGDHYSYTMPGLFRYEYIMLCRTSIQNRMILSADTIFSKLLDK